MITCNVIGEAAVSYHRTATQRDARSAADEDQRRLTNLGTGGRSGALDIFVEAFRTKWPELGAECHETLRALVLRASKNVEALDVGRAYLQGREETEPGERRHWGIPHSEAKNPQWIVGELLRLLALTGPSVIAVDQIDPLMKRYGGRLDGTFASAELTDDRQLNLIAGGLMDLREQAPRTLCILSCLPATWSLIKNSMDTAADRFRHVVKLETIPSPEVAQALVAKRFTPILKDLDPPAPYPTWPIMASAFDDAPAYTPRGLLQRIDEHVTMCLNRGSVSELSSLDDKNDGYLSHSVPATSDGELRELDQRFRELCAQADISGALDSATEDGRMPELIAAGLRCWIDEQGPEGKKYHFDEPVPGKNGLHGRLRRTLNDELEDEEHWAFRGIASTHPRAALTRLRDAFTLSGSTEGGFSRKARRPSWERVVERRANAEGRRRAGRRWWVDDPS